MSKYIVEQHTGYQYEPIPEGDFDCKEAAINGMRELEAELGWRNMRVVDEDTGEIVELGQE